MAGGSRLDLQRPVNGFDGLRACAAVLVLSYHAGNVVGATSVGVLAPLVAGLKAGVTIFFVISGFLLYLPHARAIRAGAPAPSWRVFGWRRAARILPGYWMALTVMTATGLITGVIGPHWWQFFGLAQIYEHNTLEGGLGVAWTLSVEVSFYAMLPLFAWGMRRLARGRSAAEAARVQLIVVLGLGLCSLAFRGSVARSVLLPVSPAQLPLATALPGLFDWFAAGIALAVLRAQWEAGTETTSSVRALAQHPAGCWMLAAAAYVVGLAAHKGEVFLSAYGVTTHLALGLAAVLFVLPAVAPAQRTRRSWPLALLCSRPLAWVGTISYGMYLWHVPLRDVIYRWLGAPRGAPAFVELFVLTLAAGICLGAASWYLIERPIQVWVRRRERFLRQRERLSRPFAATAQDS